MRSINLRAAEPGEFLIAGGEFLIAGSGKLGIVACLIAIDNRDIGRGGPPRPATGTAWCS